MENIVRPLECISVDSTMLEAMSMLVSRRVHRLPILSDAGQNDVLCMATHGTILWHIVENVRARAGARWDGREREGEGERVCV